ncbi:hypothetical protein QPK87_06310 [Kamptonema cortianum]|nr:hypothetical protein [Geitlerinema splendidum]MDK3156186.1 hypothetical protein [Kamptonema cortianum]
MYELRRCFIGVRLPEQIIEQLVQIQTEVRRKDTTDSIKWIGKRELALNLMALGEIPHERISSLTGLLRENVASQHLNASAEGVTGLPNAVMPKAVAIQVQGIDPLKDILERIRPQVLNSLDVWAFQPVIELGRIRVFNDQARSSIGRALRMSKDLQAGTFAIAGLDLIAHEADASGPYLHVLEHVPFGVA